MNNTPKWLRDIWAANPAKRCMRDDEGDCRGRLTKEHAIIFANKQLQEDWAILDICEFHHQVGIYQNNGKLNKEKHIWLAINRATPERLKELSRGTNYVALKERLNRKYGAVSM